MVLERELSVVAPAGGPGAEVFLRDLRGRISTVLGREPARSPSGSNDVVETVWTLDGLDLDLSLLAGVHRAQIAPRPFGRTRTLKATVRAAGRGSTLVVWTYNYPVRRARCHVTGESFDLDDLFRRRAGAE